MIANNNVCHGKPVVEQKYLILKKTNECYIQLLS